MTETTTISPDSAAAVSAAVTEARAANSPLVVKGGGTRSADLPNGTVLSLAGLSGITRYDPGALTLIALAGTPIAVIETALAAENQMLAFEPMDHRTLLGTEGTPTLGGAMATNASGPRRVLSGACRDFLLGTHFVNGEGTVLKNGGRVMKNVTGLDLSKLLCGAQGTLGVVTEIALKVLPLPAQTMTLAFADLDASEATGLMTAALATPFEVSGAAYLPDVDGGTAYLRIGGLDSQITYRRDRLTAHFPRHDATTIEGQASVTLWAGIRDAAPIADRAGPVWRIGAKATDAAAITRALRERLSARCMLDWGGGLIWAQIDTQDADHIDAVKSVLAPYAARARLLRGSATERAQAAAAFAPVERIARLSDALRTQFDPDRVFNPHINAA